MGKKQNGVRTIVDNPLKSQKIKENPLALAIWICYNYEAVLAEQDIWL